MNIPLIVTVSLVYGAMGALSAAGAWKRIGWLEHDPLFSFVTFAGAFLFWPLWLPVAWLVTSIQALAQKGGGRA